MKIGISTAVRTEGENWDRMQDLLKLGYGHIEFYNKITRIRLSDVDPLKKLMKMKELSYSFHSMVQDLFCKDKIIERAEYFSLMAEIKIASAIGCKRIIFHISKKENLSAAEKKKLVDLANFAKKNSIKLCLENNSSSGFFSSDKLPEIINSIDNLFFCLDLGHLNIALQKQLVSDFKMFIERTRNKLEEVHIHYNNGLIDQHKEFSKKGLEFLDKTLVAISKKDIDLIIETKNIKQAEKIKTQIQKYV